MENYQPTNQMNLPQNPSFPNEGMSEEYQKREQKKQYCRQIRKVGGRCALILLLIGAGAQGSSYLFYRFIGQMEQNGYLVSEGMSNFITGYLPAILGDLIALALGFFLLRPLFLSHHELFAKPQKTTEFTLWGVLGALGAATAGSLFFTQFMQMMSALGIPMTVPSIDTNDSFFVIVLSLIYVCVLGPILEELIFRGLILKSLERFGKMTAIVVSSAAFGLFHTNPQQLFFAVTVGLVLGYLTLETKSIFPAMLAHIVNNTIRTIPVYIFDIDSPIMLIISFLIILLGLVGILVFAYRYGRGFTNLLHQEDVSIVPVGQKIWQVCRSVPGILYLLFELVMGILVFRLYF